MRLGNLLTRSLAPAALCAIALAACGSQRAATTPSRTTTASASAANAGIKTLYVYSSLPHNGPQRAESHQIEQGIEFAMARLHHRVGSYRIRYRPLSDSTPQPSSRSRSSKRKAVASASHGWNPTATIRSAQQAATNPRTVAYIGELNSRATELSLPILNQAGIVQLTPGSGYPGLTEKVTGVTVTPGEPSRYYPQQRATLLRLVPNDIMEAAAIVSWLKQYPSCHTLAAATVGGDVESTAMVAAIARTAKLYGLGFVPTNPPGTDPKNYETYGAMLQQHGVSCFVLTGPVTRAAVALTNEVNLKLPVGSVIVGTSGLCNAAWSDQLRGGVSARAAASLYCTTPVIPLRYYPNGARFREKYRRVVGRMPTAYTYFGYLAGSLVMQAIGDIGTMDSRSQVMFNLVANGASTDLQTYTFDGDGDLSGAAANYYGLDRIVGGIPKHYKVLAPSKWLPSQS